MSIALSAPLPTVILAAVSALAVAGCGVHVDFGDDATRRTETETVPIGDLRRLSVSTENGAVEVRGGDVDDIEVTTVLRERSTGDADHEVRAVDDTLVLTGECDGRWWHGCTVGFVVTVPSDFDVEIDTDNGRVELDDIDGTVVVETDNGAVTASGLGASTAEARTDNGRIVLAFDAAPTDVTARTDNGAIAIRVPDDEHRYDVDASSDNGRVDVDVVDDPDAARRISAESDNGAVDIEPITR